MSTRSSASLTILRWEINVNQEFRVFGLEMTLNLKRKNLTNIFVNPWVHTPKFVDSHNVPLDSILRFIT